VIAAIATVAWDIDSLATAPTSVGFAIETKASAYGDRHLARVRVQAAWMSRRRRRWCRRAAVPVTCVVRARGVQRCEPGVLATSLDRFVPRLTRCRGRPWSAEALTALGGASRRAPFGEPPHDEQASQRFTQRGGRLAIVSPWVM
jgi:hypothetical protein